MLTSIKKRISDMIKYFSEHRITALLCLFTVNVLFWGIISDFDKTIAVYADELRYFDIARSIASGKGIQIYNVDSGFQKILYSIIIAPAFLFKDPFIQVKAVAWINSIVISSAIFPTYLLAKEILCDRKWTWIILGFTLTMPVFVNTSFFMSENIFLPLSLWMVYVFWKIFITEDIRKKLIFCSIGGFLCYLTYLNKEISLYFIIAYIITEIVWGIMRKDILKSLPGIAVFLGVFLLFFLMFKFTLFAGTGNSYNQTGIEVLSQSGRLSYLFYALFVDTIFITLGLFLFPVVISTVMHKDIRSDRSKFAIFTVMCVAVACAAIAYTITIREDFPLLSPRIHTRYIEPLTVPLIIMMVNALTTAHEDNKPSIGFKLTVGLTVLYSALFLFFTKGVSTGGCYVDTLSLMYFKSYIYSLELLSLPVNIGLWVIRILAVIAITVLLYIFKRSAKTFLVVLFIGAALLNITNTVIMQCNAFIACGLDIDRETVKKANDKLCSLDGNLLTVTYDYWDHRVIDTYVTKENYKTSVDIIKSHTGLTDNKIDLTEATIYASCLPEINPYPDLDKVDYILWVDVICDNMNIALDPNTVTKVEDFYLPGYTLYKNIDNTTIVLTELTPTNTPTN